MNAAEQIVDAYFKMCRDCFTISDRKVPHGNNRQIDILAYNIKTKAQYHVEVGVTHQLNWCPTVDILKTKFDGKFFGKPQDKPGGSANTDAAKGKNYFDRITATYRAVGFEPENIKRVWVCWIVKGKSAKPFTISYKPEWWTDKAPVDIQVLSMRDFVLPELEKKVGTSNYDDVILRTLGFFRQRSLKKAVGGEVPD